MYTFVVFNDGNCENLCHIMQMWTDSEPVGRDEAPQFTVSQTAVPLQKRGRWIDCLQFLVVQCHIMQVNVNLCTYVYMILVISLMIS